MAFDTFATIPAGALISFSDIEREGYIRKLYTLPKNVFAMVSSAQTGAYLRGITKVNNLPIEQAEIYALAVLRVALGDLPLASMGAFFSSQLQLANDMAQNIAKEIEKELFAPAMLEFNQFLSQQKQQPKMPIAQAPNVINLKNQPTMPRPVPPKPFNPTSLSKAPFDKNSG